MTIYKKLNTVSINGVSKIFRPAANCDADLSRPASDVFTNFEIQKPLMLEASTSVDEARELMTRAHVKLKLVIDQDEQFKGIISLSQLVSSRVLKIALARGVQRQDLAVADVMTPADGLHAVNFEEFSKARIGDILETLEKNGDRYIFVVDPDQSIRGLVSADDLAARLHVPVHIDKRADTFASIYNVLHY